MNLFNLDLNPTQTFTYQTVEATTEDLNRENEKFKCLSRNWVANPRDERLNSLYERQKQLLVEMQSAIEVMNRKLYS